MVMIMLMMQWSLSQITPPSHSLACQCGAKFTAKEPLVTFMRHRRGFKPRFTDSDLGLASGFAGRRSLRRPRPGRAAAGAS